MNLHLQLWVALAISVAAGVFFFFDIRDNFEGIWPPVYLLTTSLMCLQGVMTLGAGWFFVSGLGNFKPELRKAYKLLCIAVIAFGLSQAQLVITAYLNTSWWLAYGFFTLPYLVTFLFFFGGVRQFAKTLGIKTRWASWPWAMGASILAVFLVIVLPHAPTQTPPVFFAITNGFIAIDGIFFLFATMTALRITRQIGPLYKSAMMWLTAGLGVAVIGAIHYVLVEFLVRLEWYYQGNLTAVILLVSSMLFLRAGYAVRLTNEIPEQYVPIGEASDPARWIDIITYSASLASQPAELDNVLDDLRLITATHTPGQVLTAEQEATLSSVYKNIEEHLVTKEPLRIFTYESLRGDIMQKFKVNPAVTKTIWLQAV